MKKLSASEQRFFENATLITASQIIFKKLKEVGITTYQLGELISMSSGEPLTSSQMDDSLPYPVYGGGGLTGFYSRYLFNTHKIAIGRVGARCGCVFITEPKAWITDNALYLTEISDLLDEGYLVRALNQLDLRQQANQAAQPVVSQKKINPQLIPVPNITLQKKIDDFLEVVERRQKGNKIENLPDLPSPLSDVRRIVARVEELAGKIEEARSLRQQALAETNSLVTSLHLSLAKSTMVKLEEILMLDERQEEVLLGKEYPQVGVKGFGGGLFAKEAVNATQTTYKVFNRLYEGAVVLSQVKGWEGAISVCSSSLADRYVSPEYRTFSCISGKAIPEYLAALVATPWFWIQLKDITRGMGGRRERTRPEQFLQMEIPMPTVAQQKKAMPIFQKVDAMKPFREDAITELDALLPSILDKAFKGEL